MNLRKLSIMSLLAVLFLSFIGWLSNPLPVVATMNNGVDTITEVMFTDSVTLSEHEVDDSPGIDVPSFINQSINQIHLNGADWSQARNALGNSSALPFSILHLGDSHLQADIATGTVRELLQYDYGNAGRGLVTPLKMAGTNQPWDYSMSSHGSWQRSKLLQRVPLSPVGFTGLSIKPKTGKTDLFIGTRDSGDDYNPFGTLVIFHDGELNVESATDRDGKELKIKSSPTDGGTRIVLSRETSGVTFQLRGNNPSIYGVNLSGDRPGVFYHVIGNNGATYASYGRVSQLGNGISNLRPNLIIISLGTNEAFGKFDQTSFLHSLDKVVREIQSSNPGTPLLLTTPMECQKNVRQTVRNAYRRHASTRNFQPNTLIKTIRDAILKYGQAHRIATYDWYGVAGGEGASTLWINDGLYSNDRVHHSSKGYRLQGFLLYEALKKTLSTHPTQR